MNLGQFADDTIILCTGNSIKYPRTSMLETVEKVHECLNENKLVLNVDKTALIVFGKIIISGNYLKRRNNTRKRTCQVSCGFSGQQSYFFS